MRAYDRATYETAGGYDPTRHVLDDQDLMCRIYQVGDFHLIDRVPVSADGCTPEHPARRGHECVIQQETVALYDRYIEANALAWAGRQGLLALDLGAAHNKPRRLPRRRSVPRR